MPTWEVGDQTPHGEHGCHRTQLERRHGKVPPELGKESDAEKRDSGEDQNRGRHQAGFPETSAAPEKV